MGKTLTGEDQPDDAEAPAILVRGISWGLRRQIAAYAKRERISLRRAVIELVHAGLKAKR